MLLCAPLVACASEPGPIEAPLPGAAHADAESSFWQAATKRLDEARIAMTWLSADLKLGAREDQAGNAAVWDRLVHGVAAVRVQLQREPLVEDLDADSPTLDPSDDPRSAREKVCDGFTTIEDSISTLRRKVRIRQEYYLDDSTLVIWPSVHWTKDPASANLTLDLDRARKVLDRDARRIKRFETRLNGINPTDAVGNALASARKGTAEARTQLDAAILARMNLQTEPSETREHTRLKRSIYALNGLIVQVYGDLYKVQSSLPPEAP
jgi:hypothetical protein